MNESNGKDDKEDKAERRSRVAKEELEAKTKGKSSKSPSRVPKSPITHVRNREDRAAKQRGSRHTSSSSPRPASTPGAVACAGSSGGLAIGVRVAKEGHSSPRVSKSPTRGDRDRDAKRRSRRIADPSAGAVVTSRPGAVSSKGEHRSSKKTGHLRPQTTEARRYSSDSNDSSSAIDASDRSGNTLKSRDDRKQDRKRARAHTPGIVSSTDDKHSAKNHSRPARNKASGVASLDRKPSSLLEEEHAVPNTETVFATTVDDDEEEEHLEQVLAETEAQVRGQEAEAQQRQETQQQDERRVEPPTGRNKNNRICFAVFCVLLIGAGVVVALFATGTFSSKVKEYSESRKQADETTGSPTFIPLVTSAPSELPSSYPTWLAYDPPPLDQCVLISQALEVDGQDKMTEKNFSVQLDVDLSSSIDPDVLVESLASALQQVTAPKMAGCDVPVVLVPSSQGRRNLRVNDEFKFIIGNEIILSVVKDDDRSCIDSPEPICVGIRVETAIYVKGNDLKNLSYISRFSDALTDVENGGVVTELGLEAPFVTIRIFSVKTLDPTVPPSIAPSSIPSYQPSAVPTLTVTESVTFPTTTQPTKSLTTSPTVASPLPSQAVSEFPTARPTQTPTPRPSLRPSVQPAPGVTPVPTPLPSKPPSLTPSSSPSVAPSMVPSMVPSGLPSTSPSLAPSDGPSLVRSDGPSNGPSNSPSIGPSDSPSTAPSRSPSLVPTTMQPSQSPTMCAVPVAAFGPQLTGHCVKWNGRDQNTGVIKLLDGDFGNTQESKDLCLEACSCYEGAVATGCEMIWGQYNRGCYVHTQEVARGQGKDLHFCHIAITAPPTQSPTTCAQNTGKFGPEWIHGIGIFWGALRARKTDLIFQHLFSTLPPLPSNTFHHSPI